MRPWRGSDRRRARLPLPHLVRCFVGSLRPGGPGPADESWAVAHLTEAEAGLWRRMSGADRRHGLAVARRVRSALGRQRYVDRPVIAAALLHDVGKVEAGLGTAGRVVATVFIVARGRERVEAWTVRPGRLRRVGRYARHPALGAVLLAGAGSDPLTVAWAAEHHLPPGRWTIEPDLAGALRAADSL